MHKYLHIRQLWLISITICHDVVKFGAQALSNRIINIYYEWKTYYSIVVGFLFIILAVLKVLNILPLPIILAEIYI